MVPRTFERTEAAGLLEKFRVKGSTVPSGRKNFKIPRECALKVITAGPGHKVSSKGDADIVK